MADTNYGVHVRFSSDAKKLIANLKQTRRELKGLKQDGATGTGAVAKGADKSAFSINKAFVNMLRFRAGLVVLGLVAKQAFDAVIGGAIRSSREMGIAAARAQKLVAEIRTLTVDTKGQLTVGLTKELQDLSVEFGQAFDVMAKAKYDVVSAGFTDAADSAEVLRVAAEAAVGGVTGIDTTARLVSSSLRAYGEEADKASEFSDTLFVGIQKGIITMPEFANSLGRVTPIAKLAGLSFEELIASVAALTQAGLRSQEATTAMRAFLSSMLSGSVETKEKLAELGITLDDGLAPAFERISQLADEDSKALADLFGNIRALTAASAIGADGAKILNEVLDAMADKSGKASDAYGIVAEQAEVMLARLKAVEEKLKQAGGIGYAEAVERVTPGLIANLDSMAEAHERASRSIGESSFAIESNWKRIKASVVPIIKDALSGAMRQLAFTSDVAAFKAFTLADNLGMVSQQASAAEGAIGSMNERLIGMARISASSDPEITKFLRSLDILHEQLRSGEIDAREYKSTFESTVRSFRAAASDWQRDVVDRLALDPDAGLSLATGIEQLILDLDRDRIKAAAEALGVDISDLVVDGIGIKEQTVGVEEAKRRIVAMISEMMTSAAVASKRGGKDISLDMSKILSVDFTDPAAVQDLAEYLDFMRSQIEDAMSQAGESGGDRWRKSMIRSLEELARDMSSLYGEAFVLPMDATAEEAVAMLRDGLERHGLGDELESLMEQYGASSGEISGAVMAERILDVLRETLGIAVDEAREAAKEAEDAIKEAQEAERDAARERERTLRRYSNEVGGVIGSTVSQWVIATQEGEKQALMLGRAIKRYVISAIIEAAARWLAFQAITGVAGLFGGGGVSWAGGAEVGGAGAARTVYGGPLDPYGPIGFARGGSVPRLAGASAGMDSVAATYTPGETVLDYSLTNRLKRVVGMMEASAAFGGQVIEGPGGGGQIINNFNVARPQGRRDSESMARTVRDMSKSIARRRYSS